MTRVFPYHEYGENHLNNFSMIGKDNNTKDLLNTSVRGQLSKIPINEVTKNSTWGGGRGKVKRKGMIDMGNFELQVLSLKRHLIRN